MGKYGGFEIILTDHAHDQYCSRVQPADRDQLLIDCQEQFNQANYSTKRTYIHLAGIWWAFIPHDPKLIFTTCYGRMDSNLPAALKWAAHHNDRINLNELI